MTIDEIIKNRLIEVHREHDVDYSSYSTEWREYVEGMTWRSLCAIVTAKGISLNEAIKIILP